MSLHEEGVSTFRVDLRARHDALALKGGQLRRSSLGKCGALRRACGLHKLSSAYCVMSVSVKVFLFFVMTGGCASATHQSCLGRERARTHGRQSNVQSGPRRTRTKFLMISPITWPWPSLGLHFVATPPTLPLTDWKLPHTTIQLATATKTER